MISLLFFMLKQFDWSISQLKDVIKLIEVIEKSMIDNMSDIISFEITLEFKYLKISF